jgi:proline iminopeptidase
MAALLTILIAFVLIALYAAYAYHAYQRVKCAARACVDCATPVNINGYDLYCRHVGVDKGLPPVILVHGGPGHSSLSFKNSIDFLAEQTRVIYYDQRGSGNSQVKSKSTDYTIEQLVEELETLRREVVKAKKIILIGHSFGGALVQRYALKYPEQVEKIVLVGSIRINNGMGNRFIWKWLGPALYSTSLGFPPADSQAADTWFTRSSEKDDVNRLFDRSQTALLENMGCSSFAPWREISLSLTGNDYKRELRQLPVPAMFLYGTADSKFTGKPVADELVALLPNCRAIHFEHSGHWPFLEEPEKFRQVVREFLAK